MTVSLSHQGAEGGWRNRLFNKAHGVGLVHS